MATHLPRVKVGPELGFWPDTPLDSLVINFVFSDEGLGGFVTWTAVTTWIARNCPQVVGRIFCLKPLIPLLQDIHAPYPEWEIYDVKTGHFNLEGGTRMYGSNYTMGVNKAERQLLNPLGTHPIDCASGFFMGTAPAPADALMPVLDYPVSRLQPRIKSIAGRYVVFPAGGTTPIRTLTGAHLNPIIAHVKKLGLTPVFLGHKDGLANNGNATLPDDLDTEGGLDLRSQTTIKEAALIMQHAACTIGIDGGLLHLATLMKDSRVIFGYNITTVENRVPRRNHGRDIAVYLPVSDELPCSGCQTRWKHLTTHHFSHCYYEEGQGGWNAKHPDRARKCMTMLFENGGERWIKAIDEILK